MCVCVCVFCTYAFRSDRQHYKDEGGTGIGRELYHFDVTRGTPGKVSAQQRRQVFPGTGDRDVAVIAVYRDEQPLQGLLVPGIAEPRFRVPLHQDQQGQNGSDHRQGGRFLWPVVQPHTFLFAGRTDVVGGPGRSVVQDWRGGR